MSPAKRIATAAITAVLLGGTPGLAAAATGTAGSQAPQQTTQPSKQTENWNQLRVWPRGDTSARNLEAGRGGRVIVATPERNNDRQQWSLSTIAGKQLIKNKATGTCLTAPSGSRGSVTLRPCDQNDMNQQWTVRNVGQGKVRISPATHPDLALTGGTRLGSAVALRTYDGARSQEWSTVPPGS